MAGLTGSLSAAAGASGARGQFLAGRRKIAELIGGADPANTTNGAAHVGFEIEAGAAGSYFSGLNNEGNSLAISTGSTGRYVFVGSLRSSGNPRTYVRPDQNPLMLVRAIPAPQAVSNNSGWFAGFTSSSNALVPTACAYVANRRASEADPRMVFVTRSGGVETETEIAAAVPTAYTNYIIEALDDGATWRVVDPASGAVLAEHTTNLPDPATALNFGVMVHGGGSFVAVNGARLAYARVEADN